MIVLLRKVTFIAIVYYNHDTILLWYIMSYNAISCMPKSYLFPWNMVYIQTKLYEVLPVNISYGVVGQTYYSL